MEQFESELSSNIGWARYDPDTRQLQVDFKNSKGVKTSTYAYEQFPAGEWEQFKEAKSKGRHFAERIRPRHVGTKLAYDHNLSN